MTARVLLDAIARVWPATQPPPVVPAARAALDAPCTGIVHDSRAARPGSVFVALSGQKADGVAFVAQAVASGAIAVVAERPNPGGVDTPWIEVADARLALALLSAEFFGHPSREMQVVGVTGTNGKTTTSYVAQSIFEAAGIRCGLMGTVTYRIGDRDVAATRTTPEAPDVHALMRQMVDAGCKACVMEVSSHALTMRRTDGIHFAAGVFTNLTRDHLDFHKDMESYFAAKRRLFEMLPPDAPALINADDPRAAALVATARRPVTYAVNKDADITPGPLSFTLQGLEFDARLPQGVLHVKSKLVGKPNVYNILAASGAAAALGVPVKAIEEGVEGLSGVPGRFEVVSSSWDDITVVVDYAHTDDALRNLLETARSLAPRRLVTVFGAGGERDTTKRPLMGLVAARLSDVVVITSDNPRGEDPERIIDEVRRGAEPATRPGTAEVVVIADRRDAIAWATIHAESGDVVLIAGKGHEKYQEIAGRVLPFDDVVVAREGLEARRVKSRVG
jgi:UDP-N-acetylmuramoyl-L-alanyl-D-glutamate--2,6-diaminopimelate ligase